MTDTSDGLGQVAAILRQPVDEFIRLVRDLAGEQVKSLALFGAASSNTFDTTRQTVRSVMVLDKFDLSLLRRLAEHGARLGKLRIAAPLVMTPEYISTSLDSFPLEFIEIHQQHTVLFGEDFFTDLSFDDSHIRLQCERELKSVLIALRQGLLAAAGREKFLEALELDVGERLARTLRGMLWLKGEKKGRPASAVLAAIEKMTERQLTGLRAALDPSAEHGAGVFNSLYTDVETLGDLVDAW